MYYNRLVRDGWSFIAHAGVGEWKSTTTFEKPLPYGWTLRKIAHSEVGAPVGKGVYRDEHELVAGRTGTITAQPAWEWADLDGKRLVWAEQGRLNGGRLTPEGLADTRRLFDATDMTFTPLKAPIDARETGTGAAAVDTYTSAGSGRRFRRGFDELLPLVEPRVLIQPQIAAVGGHKCQRLQPDEHLNPFRREADERDKAIGGAGL